MPNFTNRPLTVFLCHASQDKPVVRELARRLTAEGWIDPWLDEKKLLPGQEWKLKIEEAVESSDVVIICLSNNSVSKEGFVQKEIKHALNIADQKPEDTIFIIPAKLEECSVPLRLNNYHWVDLSSEDGYKQLVQSLYHRATMLDRIPVDVAEGTQPKLLSSANKLMALIGGSRIILIALVAFVIMNRLDPY